MTTTVAAEPTDRSRKAAILVAAQPVFFRYGYRKTSMDDVAKAADVSRQGLYVHFARKEDLFREMIDHGLGLHVREARAALSDAARPIGQRLVVALNEWFGDRDKFGADSDLPQAGLQIAGAIIQDYRGQFEAAICRAIETSELMAVYGARGISATQITDTLMATCRGINYSVSNETFVERVTVAVLMLTAPCLPGKSLGS